MNTAVIQKIGNIYRTAQNGTIDSLDTPAAAAIREAAALAGEEVIDLRKRAPLATILHESWTPEERAEFGIYVIEIDPPEGQTWTGLIGNDNGQPVLLYEPVVIAPEQVVRERARRLAAGFDFDFGDSRGVHRIGTTAADMTGWDAVTKWAQAKLALGHTEHTKIILTDTGPVTISPLEWFQIVQAADAVHGPLYQASFALQAMQPIPLDYADDSYWQ